MISSQKQGTVRPFTLWHALIIVLAIALVAIVAYGLVLVSTNGHPGLFFGQTEEVAVVSARNSKLGGAKETVDANGVVHGKTPAGISYLVYGRGSRSVDIDRISFAALGDVFATDMNLDILDSYDGEVGDGRYSFEPYYREIGPIIRTYDIAFANQETAMAGNKDGFVYTGYPDFNTPESSAEAMSHAGIDVVNFGSNHSWDMGEQGILNTHAYLARYPQMMVVGSYLSQSDRDTVHMIECNGTTIAFLSYVYGTNAFAKPEDFPNTYYTCPFQKKIMEMEIHRAQQVADAVVVYMHWGTEYISEPDEQQLEYAQFLADLNVDLVIGSHAHILQPTRYFTSSSGKRIPVVFGLSDLISGWTLTDTILSQMFTCDFVWQDDVLTLDNLACYPLVEWSDGGDVYVRFLKDMDGAAMEANMRTEDIANDAEYFDQFFDDLGMEIPVVR